MAHFAKLNSENVVDQVLAVHNNDAPDEAAGIAFLNDLFGEATWVQTSYNGNIRKNYAGVGFTYDATNDVFYAPQPFDNWVLNTTSWLWEPPIAMPVDEYFYTWNQETTAWVQGDLRPIPEPIPEPVVETPVEAVVDPVVEPVAATEPVVEPVVETPVAPETPVEQA